MLNFCILNNPRTFLILLKLFTQVTLLLKLRKACKLRRRNLLFQNFLRSNALVVPAVLNLFFLLYKFAKTCRKRRTLTKPHSLIALLQRYRVTVNNCDVWNKLSHNWDHFSWLTGETPDTLNILIDRLKARINLCRKRGRLSPISTRNQILLTFIWLRRYPTMQHLASQFRVSVSLVHKIIHRYIYVLHAYLVPKYLRWHSMQHWRRLAGMIPEWPTVVAVLDCTPIRISRPTGAIQRLYYRGDRHCHFLNYFVIIDTLGYVCYSRPGFLGHLNDINCFNLVNIPVLPRGLRIMADQGFPNVFPLLLPLRANRQDLPEELKK